MVPRAPNPDVTGLYSSIGERVRTARERAGVSREQLAAQADVSKTSIAQFEAGHQRLPLETIYLVAATLGVGIEALLPSLAELTLPRTDLVSKIEQDENLNTDERQALLGFFKQHAR